MSADPESQNSAADTADSLRNPLLTRDLDWHSGASPGALLRAECGVVPFHGRDQEFANLLDWCAAEEPVQVRLYTGAGGMGKTRLALELARQLRKEGWQTGFLASDPTAPAAAWSELWATGGPGLVVIDYAETHRDLLIPFVRQMVDFTDGKIRLLLLARAALDWWDQLKNEEEGVGDLLSGPATRWFTLQPLAWGLEDRQASYLRGVKAFSERLGTHGPTEPPEGLEDSDYERVLLLHMRALADIEGVPVKDEDGVLDHVLERERRFWGKLAVERQLPASLADGIGRAMGLITLGGGAVDEEHAVAALGALKVFASEERSVLVEVTRLLRASYPGEKWIEPILPDLLGEHLIQRELEKGADELLDLVLGARSVEAEVET